MHTYLLHTLSSFFEVFKMDQLLDNPEFRMQIAAYLYSKQQDQKTIANQLHISQSQVSRLLKQAIDQGLLVRSFEFNQEGITKKRFQEIKNFQAPVQLIENLKIINSNLINVKIFDSGSNHDSYSERLISFAHNASSYLKDLLAEVNVIGVTWGNTLSNLVDALVRRYSYTPSRTPKSFVPLCAELLGVASEQYHSTMIADRLNEIVNKRKSEHLSLSGISAFIPRYLAGNELDKDQIELDKDQIALLWKIVKDSSNYRAIFVEFENEEPFINKLDCILTSLGPIDAPSGPSILSEQLEKVFPHLEKIKSEIIGDIGGILLKRESNETNEVDQQVTLLKDLEEMWTGITFKQMKDIADKSAASENMQGVVVFAHGKNKAPVLFEAIKRGLVNQIVIDFELSKELEKLINKK